MNPRTRQQAQPKRPEIDPAHDALADVALWLNIATWAIAVAVAVVVIVSKLGP